MSFEEAFFAASIFDMFDLILIDAVKLFEPCSVFEFRFVDASLGSLEGTLTLLLDKPPSDSLSSSELSSDFATSSLTPVITQERIRRLPSMACCIFTIEPYF